MKIIVLISLFTITSFNAFSESDFSLSKLKLPLGFSIKIYAKVPGARSMALGKNDTVFVGTKDEGKLFAILNKRQSKDRKVIEIASHLNMPNGVAYHEGDLYVAEVNKIWVYRKIDAQLLSHQFHAELFTDQLPDLKTHGWRYMKFGPDRWLYITIGAPCNNCISKNPIFATIARLNIKNKKLEIYAKGIRNSLGIAWEPQTNYLWFTDNGRDWLGDDLPPDELNIATHQGMDFGFPYFFGNNQLDPIYGHLASIEGKTPSALNLPAHSATLGLSFYTGNLFPQKYHNQIFICEHGSWNRSKKVGYEVVWVTIKNHLPIKAEPFISGWLVGQTAYGRPVDNLMLPDGTLLISDDKLGLIYQVIYKK